MENNIENTNNESQENKEVQEIKIVASKPKGSVAVLILWIIFFWPAAIVYGVIREW